MLTPDRQKTVLVVCDDAKELKIISSLMKKVDFCAFTAPVHATSLDGYVERGDAIDLAIIDGDELAANGSGLLQYLHERYPMVRLIFISSETDGRRAEIGPAGHIRRYLPRPVRKAQLLGTVLAIMDAPSTLAA
jgi:DNA-binding NtrC family response regulator